MTMQDNIKQSILYQVVKKVLTEDKEIGVQTNCTKLQAQWTFIGIIELIKLF